MMKLGTLFMGAVALSSAAEVRVNSPESLVLQLLGGGDTDFEPYAALVNRPALFGIPAYMHGGTLTARVAAALVVDKDACEAITREEIVDWPTDPNTPVILLAERGTCTFVTKTRHAQDIGAQAVVIVDNLNEGSLPYMADDGHGSDITIPAALIFKEDGDLIFDSLAAGNQVTMTLKWNVPHPDNRVEWEFWTSADDLASSSFKATFEEAARVLGASAQMTPHYVVQTSGYSQLHCTNSGRYCHEPLIDGLAGSLVIQENLRQLCLFRVLNNTSTEGLYPHHWWTYVTTFEERCPQFDKTCSDTVMNEVGVDPAEVQVCVDASGGAEHDGPINTIFEAEFQLRLEENIWFMPTVLVNDVPYRGSLNCPAPLDLSNCGVLEEICAGFENQSIIDACISSPGCPLGIERDACGICGGVGDVDACGLCLNVSNPLFNKTCAGCDGIPHSGITQDQCGVCGGTGIFDACGRCMDPTSPRFNQSCSGCDGIPHSGKRWDVCGVCGGEGRDPCGVCGGTGSFDVCGVCMEPTNPQYNMTCAGCDGVPFSGKTVDVCGVCDGPGKDPCGTCGGSGQFDVCGACLAPTNPQFNQTCAGCDGVPYSGKTVDICGICGGPGKDPCGVCGGSGMFDICGVCMDPTNPRFNTSCVGCDGVEYSGKKVDECGVCGGPGRDTCGKCGGNGTRDVCGQCLEPDDPFFNKTCLGCDGIPHSKVIVDECGVCGGRGRDNCGKCYKSDDDPRRVEDDAQCPTSAPVVKDTTDTEQPAPTRLVSRGLEVLLIIVGVLLAIALVVCYFHRRERAMRQDIDNLLKQYVPMAEGDSSSATAPAQEMTAPAEQTETPVSIAM